MIKVGVVGNGISAKYYHLPFIKSTKGYKLVSILEKNNDQTKKFYQSDLDLIIITTPNELHYKQAKMALEHNKHVLIEKPMCLKFKEAEDLYNLAEQKKLTINPYFNRRYDSDFLQIQKLLKKHEQSLLVFNSHFNKYIPNRTHTKWKYQNRPGAGIYFDIAPHLIDQTLLLFGKPKSIQSKISTLKEKSLTDDYFFLQFDYEGFVVNLGSSGHTWKPCHRFNLQFNQLEVNTFGTDRYDAISKGEKAGVYECKISHFDKKDLSIELPPANYGQFYRELRKSIELNKNFIDRDLSLLNVKIVENLKKKSSALGQKDLLI